MKSYYADDAATLYLGDALAVLRELPDASVDCCMTSPPYYGLRDYGQPGQYGLEDSPAAYVEQMRVVFAEVRRVLADDGTLFVNLGDSYSRGITWDARSCGTTGIRLEDCLGGDCPSTCRCGARQESEATRCHNARNGIRPAHGSAPCASGPTPDHMGLRCSCLGGSGLDRPSESEQSDLATRGLPPAPPLANEPPRACQGSMIDGSCRPHRAECSRWGSCACDQQDAGSSSSCVRQSVRNLACTCDIARLSDSSDSRRSDTVSCGSAWGDSTSKFLPAKNLLGIPWRVAFALQDDGWILRNDIIWSKPNAMPRVRHRPTLDPPRARVHA